MVESDRSDCAKSDYLLFLHANDSLDLCCVALCARLIKARNGSTTSPLKMAVECVYESVYLKPRRPIIRLTSLVKRRESKKGSKSRRASSFGS